MFRQLLRPVVRNVQQRASRSYHEVSNYKPPTMDELPVPQGSWQQAYDAKQRSYNLQLAIGVIYCIGTIAYATTSGVIFWNWAPPVPKDEQ